MADLVEDHREDFSEENAVVDDNNEEIVITDYDYNYDAHTNIQEQGVLYFFYQPEETDHGTFICRICKRGGKINEFPDRLTFSAHRYKRHGTFNNTIVCPIVDCRESFASITPLRVHLKTSHDEPLEVHHKTFANVGEFERWRHLVETSSNTRFITIAKQPKNSRQMLHCNKSEHRMVMQTKSQRIPRIRMNKPGSCCPALISYQIETNGEVGCYYQLHHVGHAEDDGAEVQSYEPYKPLAFHFPNKPLFYADSVMQYVQIDLHEIETSVYGNAIYEHILFVTDAKSDFMWAKPISSAEKSLIFRLLVDIFIQYGIPEGYSTSYSADLIREAMASVKNVFTTEIREVWKDPAFYYDIQDWAIVTATSELGSPTRWVEALQFAIMEVNQKPKRGCKTPFEKMFHRKPPTLYDEAEEDVGDAQYPARPETNIQYPQILYNAGDRVYLRQYSKKVGRSESHAFLYALIAEVDKSSPLYPYKVHYSKREDPWPTERNEHVWVSALDVLPTTHSIREFLSDDSDQASSSNDKDESEDPAKNSQKEKREVLAQLYCRCSGQRNEHLDNGISKCNLIKNELCVNHMARYCCLMEGEKTCRYHTHYPIDDSYKRIEQGILAYNKIKRNSEGLAGMEHVHPSQVQKEKLIIKTPDPPISRKEKRRAEEIKDSEVNPTARKSSRKITKKAFENFVS